MRQFSELEKEIVKRLSEWEVILKTQPTNHYMVTFDALINDISIKYNGKMIISVGLGIFPSIELQTANSSSLKNYKINNQMTRDIINTVNFLDYLSKNELIYFISPNRLLQTWTSPVELGKIIGNDTIHTNTIEDASFVDKVKLFYSKEIYPTQTLIDYYNNDYKSDEELRHNENTKFANDSLIETQKGLKISIQSLYETRKGLKISEDSLEESKKSIILSSKALEDSQKNLKIARIALITAAVLGIIGTIGSGGEVYYAWVGAKNTDTKIDSSQFKTIDERLQQIEKVDIKLDKVLEQLNSNDTLITKVINFPKTK
jgi:hypothetical protein